MQDISLQAVIKFGAAEMFVRGGLDIAIVKNYNIETKTNNLINNVSSQALDRQIHLPQGMQQRIVIDVRGQNLTPLLRDKITKGIEQKSNGIIKSEQIKFMTE